MVRPTRRIFVSTRRVPSAPCPPQIFLARSDRRREVGQNALPFRCDGCGSYMCKFKALTKIPSAGAHASLRDCRLLKDSIESVGRNCGEGLRRLHADIELAAKIGGENSEAIDVLLR